MVGDGNVVRRTAYAAWPVGLALVLAYTMGGVLPAPVFVAVDAAFAVAVALVYRRLGAWRGGDRAGTALATAGVALFVLVGVVGPPTGREPMAMLLNAVVLLLVAVALLAATVHLAMRVWSGSSRFPAALAVVALGVGSVGYLLNLLARWAVVLSGAAPAQAAIEDRAWVAYSYLPGLDGDPSFLTYLLVWLDLVQLTYVVLAYLAFAALAVALGRAGLLTAAMARGVAVAGSSLGALVMAGAVVALAAGAGPLATGAAWTSFVLTIPFMTTLLPHVLGVALVAKAAAARTAGEMLGVDAEPAPAALAGLVR
jgi:hypothetical protein